MMQFGGTVTMNGLIVYVGLQLGKGAAWSILGSGCSRHLWARLSARQHSDGERLNSAVGEVALSALSRIKDDPDRLKSYFLKGYSLVVAFTLPITITCALFADDLIFVVLGPKWSERPRSFVCWRQPSDLCDDQSHVVAAGLRWTGWAAA